MTELEVNITPDSFCVCIVVTELWLLLLVIYSGCWNSKDGKV